MKRKLVIDRIEGVIAVCETEKKEKIYVLKKDLPVDIKEGDFIIQNYNGPIRFDEIATKKKRIEMQQKLISKWDKG